MFEVRKMPSLTPRHDVITIRPEYSAVAAKDLNHPSRATQAATSVFKEMHITRVCEIGCGLLANTLHFLEAFPHVILTDREAQYERIKDRLREMSRDYRSFAGFMDDKSFARRKLNLDGAILINVLHILPSRPERVELLSSAWRNLRKGGLAFIDVPRNETFYRDLVKNAAPYHDGYAIRRDDYSTFYKNLTFDDLKGYSEEAGFELERRVFLGHRTTFVCRKPEH
jgi:SAM-dependent methyltransferase